MNDDDDDDDVIVSSSLSSSPPKQSSSLLPQSPPLSPNTTTTTTTTAITSCNTNTATSTNERKRKSKQQPTVRKKTKRLYDLRNETDIGHVISQLCATTAYTTTTSTSTTTSATTSTTSTATAANTANTATTTTATNVNELTTEKDIDINVIDEMEMKRLTNTDPAQIYQQLLFVTAATTTTTAGGGGGGNSSGTTATTNHAWEQQPPPQPQQPPPPPPPPQQIQILLPPRYDFLPNEESSLSFPMLQLRPSLLLPSDDDDDDDDNNNNEDSIHDNNNHSTNHNTNFNSKNTNSNNNSNDVNDTLTTTTTTPTKRGTTRRDTMKLPRHHHRDSTTAATTTTTTTTRNSSVVDEMNVVVAVAVASNSDHGRSRCRSSSRQQSFSVPSVSSSFSCGSSTATAAATAATIVVVSQPGATFPFRTTMSHSSSQQRLLARVLTTHQLLVVPTSSSSTRCTNSTIHSPTTMVWNKFSHWNLNLETNANRTKRGNNPLTTTTTSRCAITTTKSILLDRLCRQNGYDVFQWYQQQQQQVNPPTETETTMQDSIPTLLPTLTRRRRRRQQQDDDNNDEYDTTMKLSLSHLFHVDRIGGRMDRITPSIVSLLFALPSSSSSKSQLVLLPNTVLIPPTTTYRHVPGTIPPPAASSTTTTTTTTAANSYHSTNDQSFRPQSQQQYQQQRSQPLLLLFGPTDPHEHIVHTASSSMSSSGSTPPSDENTLTIMDESIYKVTISSILQQMSMSLGKVPSSSSSLLQQQQQELQSQLRHFVQQVVHYNSQSHYYRRLSRHLSLPDVMELPLAYYYTTLMEYCSILLSGIATSNDINNQNDDGNGDDDDRDCNFVSTTLEQVYELLERHAKHNGLQTKFPKLHLVHGLVRICRILPTASSSSSVLAIIAGFGTPTLQLWSTDDHTNKNTKNSSGNANTNKSPIHIFRTLLENLEENQYLVEQYPSSRPSQHGGTTTITVGELEYTLYRVSNMIQTHCLPLRDIHESSSASSLHTGSSRCCSSIMYRCYYTGIIASCLVLCSGQQITSETTPATITRSTDHKTKKKKQQPHQRTSSSKSGVRFQTIRRPLPKFQELRKQLAMAIYHLLQLCDHTVPYPNPQYHRVHLAILSILEWDQVMALLLYGHTAVADDDWDVEELDLYYHHFYTLYHYHKLQWTYHENTTTSYSLMQECAMMSSLKGANIDTDDVTIASNSNYDKNLQLHKLASQLELDPSNTHQWYTFVEALGPIICHDTDDDDVTKKLSWWGYHRTDWWYDCLLQPPHKRIDVHTITNSTQRRGRPKGQCKNQTTNKNTLLREMIVSQLKLQLKPIQPKNSLSADDSSATMDHHAFSTTSSPPSYDWLDTFMNTYIERANTSATSNHRHRKRKSVSSDSRCATYIPFVQQRNNNNNRCQTSTNSTTGTTTATSSHSTDDSVACTVDTATTTDNDSTIASCKMIGFKVLIVCHLYHEAHIGIHVYVQMLSDMLVLQNATVSSDDDDHEEYNCIWIENHPAYQTLCWLCSMGVNVTKIVSKAMLSATI